MENKPQNIFEKLDKQSEQIEDISAKFEGINITDLYVLAKRTWDYGDFKTAQKYYNHISLLRPLDWEAPLMASLCNFSGVQDVRDIETSLPLRIDLYYATIKYLLQLDLNEEKKQDELKKCIDIIKTKLEKDKNAFYKNKDVFERGCINFIENLENSYIDFYERIKDINNSVIDELKRFTLDCFFDLVEKANYLSSSVDETKYNEYRKNATKAYNIDLDKLLLKKSKCEIGKVSLSNEDKNEIKLHGILCYEYDDKVIAQRKYRKKLIYGIIYIFISILGIISSLMINWPLLFVFIPSLLEGVLLIIKAIAQKDIINCYSFLCIKPKRTRLSSKGNIVVESKINFMYVCIVSLLFLQLFFCIFFGIYNFVKKDNVIFNVIFLISSITYWILYLLTIKKNDEYLSPLEGKYKYLYKGKYYKVD